MVIENRHNQRLAIIGCGAVSEILWWPALKKSGWRPSVVIDRVMDRARYLQRLTGARVVGHEAGQCLDAFDAAIIAVPHALHADVAIPLLEQGKHVLIEKPMALRSGDCDRIIAAARRGGGVLAVGLMRRYLHSSRWLKGLLDVGALGEVESFNIFEGTDFSWPVVSDAVWRKDLSGGGVLADTGAHVLDQMLWWFGEVESVTYYDDNLGGIEADCRLELIMKSGVRGVVELSRTRDLPSAVIVKGAKGIVRVSTISNDVQAKPESLLDLKVPSVGSGRQANQSVWDLFRAQINDLRRAINGKGAAGVGGEEGARSVRLIDRCYADRQPWNLPWVMASLGKREDEGKWTETV